MTVAVPAAEGITLVPLTRVQYDALVETGALDDARVELLEGALVEMAPQGLEHANLVVGLNTLLVRGLPEPLRLRPALPFAATDTSEPEPDFAVVSGSRPVDSHPQAAVLVIEVSQSSLRKDLGVKAQVYAEAGVPTYWVVDLGHRVVHVHAEPSENGYGDVRVVPFTTALDAAGVRVVLSELV